MYDLKDINGPAAGGKPYNDFGAWLRAKLGGRVQKISVDAGLTCPNRDGTLGRGGCAFCSNAAFSPAYCADGGVRRQIERGKAFFAGKYPGMRYMAYFQAYSNTYAPLDTLKRLYEEALSTDGVAGIVIATRPDCVDPQKLDYIQSLARQTLVIVEYGIETANDATLKAVNRGHTFECARRTIADTADRGILTGGHIIIGLPGEDRRETLSQAATISRTGVGILKLHQLQIIRGTPLAAQHRRQPLTLYTPDEYASLAEAYLQRLRPDILIARLTAQAPESMVVAPRWGLKNHEFTDKLVKLMRHNGTYQGQLYNNDGSQ